MVIKYIVQKHVHLYPVKINSFLTGGLIRGIHYSTHKRKWVAQCQCGEKTKGGKKKQTYLGSYLSEGEALKAYKEFKISLIKDLELEYPLLPKYIFENLRKVIQDLK